MEAKSRQTELFTRARRGVVMMRHFSSVKKDLVTEPHSRPHHKLHHIDWALGAIDIQLRLFKRQIENRPIAQQHSAIRKLIENIKPFKHPRI